ncbi:MAG: alpha/beta hydrolase [Prevotella sp.]|nr:alpha/beta hydrolase [Prevotella sp.]
MKLGLWAVLTTLATLLIIIVGSSAFMLSFSLSPDPDRADTDSCYRQLFSAYPETRPWVDSLRRIDALRDTFLTMPSGERHHAYYVSTGSHRTAIVVHGWRGSAIKFFYLARMYEQLFGYNVVIPDLHAHGLSQGTAIGMGWPDRFDMLRWMEAFRTDTMVVHGVSMGAATTMMLSAERMPDGVRDIRFVEDCGYTNVWDEFATQMNDMFGLPPFPVMYTSSLLCKWRHGWSFGEASAIEQVSRCPHPMLFIHGDADTFVPTAMVYRLYQAKPSQKELWVVKGAAHALAYSVDPTEYARRVARFIGLSPKP